MNYSTRVSLLQLGHLDPEVDAWIQSHPDHTDYSSLSARKATSEQLRKAILQQAGPVPPTITRSEISYPTYDGASKRALLFQPNPLPKHEVPLIFLIHGGGWCLGSPEANEASCRNYVLEFGAVCFTFEYRLAPEHKFPIAVHDCWSALIYAVAEARSWGAELEAGFIVGGMSSGGNLAAVMAMRATREDLAAPLTGLYLGCAALCPQGKMPEKYQELFLSHEQNENAPILPKLALDTYYNAYEPDLDHQWFNLFAWKEGYANLPRTYSQVCGADRFRDEDLIFDRMLKEEYGIETRLDLYPGMPHGSQFFYPTLKSSGKYRADLLEGFRWLLRRDQ